jgi:hypothetical protein
VVGWSGNLLSPDDAVDPRDVGEPADARVLRDLNLDQIVAAIVTGRDEPEFLADLFRRPVTDLAGLRYRQEIFADLADPSTLAHLTAFSTAMRQVRVHLAGRARMYCPYQQQGWFLDAASIYCTCVAELAEYLGSVPIHAQGLRRLRSFLLDHSGGVEFRTLAAQAASCRSALAGITYCVRVHGLRVRVGRFEGQSDYSVEVEDTFARFQQGAVRDYLATYRGWPAMNHVGAQILERVALLYPEEFAELDSFCTRHPDFVAPALTRADRELQFYLAYLEHTAPVRAAGVQFCLPRLEAGGTDIHARDAVDLALADALVRAERPVVRNEFHLSRPERIFLVSGPNQGGKTTFARMFGQLHHLAALGVPVPASDARLVLFDRLYTHFGRTEDLSDLRGKLEDDLVRVRAILGRASARSVVILNELFNSTALQDARVLGAAVMNRLVELDVVGVYVTFVVELAGQHDSVVSMVSTVAEDNPAERTFRVIRAPADGLAHALALAAEHGLSHERLARRLGG